jgi:hypothetical protein
MPRREGLRNDGAIQRRLRLREGVGGGLAHFTGIDSEILIFVLSWLKQRQK